MRAWIEKAWQQGHPLLWGLAPLMLLFWLVSSLRRQLFRWGIKRQASAGVPVIIVGNISVGGNGKTPMVLWLVDWLRRQGYKPGVISRGYGGASEHYPLLVTPDSGAATVGDEPVLIAQRARCPMAVGPDRIAAARLLQANHDVNIIVSDDGLQHYRLGRDIELVIIDGERRLGNGHLLPMGPLREGASRLASVDMVIVNGGEARPGEVAMVLESGQWRRVADDEPVTLDELRSRPAVAMAGIGNPRRFFDTVSAQGLHPVRCQPFVDHQHYDAETLVSLAGGDTALLMTEKDAVKCRAFAKENWYYLPVTARLPAGAEQQLRTKLKEVSHGV